MRCIAFIIFIVLFNKQVDAQPSNQGSQPKFIENISINPAPQNVNARLEPRDKYSVNKNIPAANGNSIEIINPLQFKYAILMDVAVEELNNSNSKLLEFIEEWYGTPYHFGGYTKDGIDCSAFAGNLIETVFGIGLPRMAKDQYKVCRRIAKDNLEEGDLVFFHTTRKGISHVGVYLGNNKFVHASLNYGVTISDLGDGYYARKLIGAGRVKLNNASLSLN